MIKIDLSKIKGLVESLGDKTVTCVNYKHDYSKFLCLVGVTGPQGLCYVYLLDLYTYRWVGVPVLMYEGMYDVGFRYKGCAYVCYMKVHAPGVSSEENCSVWFDEFLSASEKLDLYSASLDVLLGKLAFYSRMLNVHPVPNTWGVEGYMEVLYQVCDKLVGEIKDVEDHLNKLRWG